VPAAFAIEDQVVALRTRKAQILRQKIDLMKKNGIAFYHPHKKQEMFHTAGISYRRRMVRAGNRFGKSHLGCAEDVAWLIGKRAWLKPEDPAYRGGIPQRPVKGLVVTVNWEKVDEVWTGTEGKLWSMLPDSMIARAVRNHSGVVSKVELTNKSVLRFYTTKAFMSDKDSAESVDYDFIHFDEPCPKDLYVGVTRGLIDRHGSEWFTLTPLAEPWISDLFFPEDTGDAMSPDCWAINGSIYDNPNLSPEAIAKFESTLTDEEKQCRLYGIPFHLAGLIYKEFSWNDHVLKEPPLGWKNFVQPPDNWPIYITIDPHPQTPHMVLFSTVSPFGVRYYFHDIFVHCGIETLIKGDENRKIEGILPFLRGRRPIWTKMDPLGFIEDPEDKNSMAIEAANAGLPVEKATKALAQGILHCKQELAKRDIHGHPVIRFCPTARRTLWEIRRWSWAEGENKPIDKDDHAMECFYRTEISNPCWIDCAPQKYETISDEEIVRPELELETIEE